MADSDDAECIEIRRHPRLNLVTPAHPEGTAMTEPAPTPEHYKRCGKCARCVKDTPRRPDPQSVDCYDAWLSAAASARRPA